MTIYGAIKYYNDLADDIDKNPLSGDDSAEARQLVEWLEELKVFRELYPDTDIESSLQKNYQQGRADAIEECIKFVDDWDNVIADALARNIRKQNIK